MGARSDYTGMDTYEQIQACLRCEKPECTNCIYYADRNGTAQKRKPRKKRPQTVQRPKSDPCQICPMRKLCKVNHWTCNEGARWHGG